MKHDLVDLRGASSLAVISDWQDWWRVWGPKIANEVGKQGWILFLLDANEKIQEVTMLVSRLLRNKPEWDSARWTQAEWENIEHLTATACAWYEENAPAPMRDAPDWAQFLFSAQHGNLCALKRAGRELRAVQEQGYLVATLERRPGIGLEFGGDAKQVIMSEAD